MRPLNSACLGRPHHISPPYAPLRYLWDDRIRMWPSPRLATGHLASSLASSPTSRLNLGIRCLSLRSQLHPPPPPQLYPFGGEEDFLATWGSFSGVSRSRFSGCQPIEPKFEFFSPTPKKRKFSTRGPPFSRSGAHPQFTVNRPQVQMCPTEKSPPSVYSFRAGGKFTDKKCLSTVTTQFAQITSHTQ